jgi:hypothetical protein
MPPRLSTPPTPIPHPPRARRPHLLFQYKPYCQQEALALPERDVALAVEAVFGPMDDAGAVLLEVGARRAHLLRPRPCMHSPHAALAASACPPACDK